MSTINSIHTPCKSCVFAEYKDITQIGCHLNYLDTYRTKNIEILEAYDNEKEFYIINNKKCIGYRENGWFEKRNLQNLSIEEKIKKFKEKNFLHYLMVVNLNNFNTSEQLHSLSVQLSHIDIKPRKIIFIRYHSNKNHPLSTIQDLLDKSNLSCKWRIQTMLEDRDYLEVLHDIVNLNKKYRFVCTMSAETTETNTVINTANKIVYENMDRFVVLTDKNKSITIFSAPNYRYGLLIENKNILATEDNHIIV